MRFLSFMTMGNDVAMPVGVMNNKNMGNSFFTAFFFFNGWSPNIACPQGQLHLWWDGQERFAVPLETAFFFFFVVD